MLALTLTAVLALFPANPAILTVQIAEAATIAPLTSPDDIAAYVTQQATWAEVPTRRALYVAGHESFFVATSTGDLTITCHQGPNRGKPVRARGVWQITDCYHPEVSDAEAYSVEWSTAWALPLLADPATCRHEWTQCRRYYGL